MIKAYLASRPPSWTFLTIILAWESLLLSVIIKRVPCKHSTLVNWPEVKVQLDTEIDFKTYLQQVRQFTLDGVTNYGLIKGDSGPVAYPAGFLYAFELVRRLCDDGKNLVSAQVSFALLYLLQLILVFLVYRKCKVLTCFFSQTSCLLTSKGTFGNFYSGNAQQKTSFHICVENV